MITEPLLNFIKGQQAQGVNNEAITKMLLGQGWAKLDVDQALKALTPPPVVPVTPPVQAQPIQPVQQVPVSSPILQSIQPTPVSQPAPVYTPPVVQQPTYTPPVQNTATPFVAPRNNFTQPNIQTVPNQKKSHTALIIAIILILLLIGGGIYAYLTFFASPKVVAPVITESTSTEAVATTTPVVTNTPATTTATTTKVVVKKVVVPVKVTTTTNSSTVKQVNTIPNQTPLPVHVKSTVTIWQNDAHRTLCWNGFQSSNCEPKDGYEDIYSTIDINGDGSVLLGAVEFCQYLDYNGKTVDKTPQNFWRLPTIDELTAKYASDPTSFHFPGYWSISPGTNSATSKMYLYINSDGTSGSSENSAINNNYVRCIQP